MGDRITVMMLGVAIGVGLSLCGPMPLAGAEQGAAFMPDPSAGDRLVNARIWIDEEAYGPERAATAFARPVSFAEVTSWSVDLASMATCPAELQKLDGSGVVMIGFIHPVAGRGAGEEFVLSPSTPLAGSAVPGTPTVPIRPPPGFTGPLPRFDPVQVHARLQLTQPTADVAGAPVVRGALPLRLHALSIDRRVIAFRGFDPAILVAAKALPAWDWDNLAHLRPPIDSAGDPAGDGVESNALASLTAWDNRWVTVPGFLVARPRHDEIGPPKLRIGRYCSLGCCGIEPTRYDSMALRMRQDHAVPDVQAAILAGRLVVMPRERWAEEGLAALVDAVMVEVTAPDEDEAGSHRGLPARHGLGCGPDCSHRH